MAALEGAGDGRGGDFGALFQGLVTDDDGEGDDGDVVTYEGVLSQVGRGIRDDGDMRGHEPEGTGVVGGATVGASLPGRLVLKRRTG